MKLKQRVDDFRVRELLEDGVLAERGRWRVYRVIKRKLTSLQAAEVLAREAGAAAGDVTMCGLKDRQGVTVQHMALERGPEVRLAGDDVRVEPIGFAEGPLESKASSGNAFEIVVRGLVDEDQRTLRRNLAQVREQGVLNYFDDQRFGNLRHGQGWIALDLMRGETEKALKSLVAASSFHDDSRSKTLKRALRSSWGDWGACRDIAGKFGAHHSVFEHLKRHPDDFAGAFYHVSSRVRLIHLYAYQSHLWNRAVVALVREKTTLEQRIVVEAEEGPLVYPVDLALLGLPASASFPLPGPELEGVADEHQRELLADALAADRLVPAQLKIENVSGFQLKSEPRQLAVVPQHLRVRPARSDPLNRGLSMVEVRFQLPRGAYATLVIRRLLAAPGRASALERDARGRETAEEPRERTRGRRPPREAGERAPRRFERGEWPERFERKRFDRGERPERFERKPVGRGDRARPGPREDRAPRERRGPPRPWERAPKSDRRPLRGEERGGERSDRREGPKRGDRDAGDRERGPRVRFRGPRRTEGQRPKGQRFPKKQRPKGPRRHGNEDGNG